MMVARLNASHKSNQTKEEEEDEEGWHTVAKHVQMESICLWSSELYFQELQVCSLIHTQSNT